VNEPFLTYGKLRFLNLPNAKTLFDEVLVEDCYRKATVPGGALVFDVGGHYGEFGLWCEAERGCSVRIYEPSPLWAVCAFNATLNHLSPSICPAAIAVRRETRPFIFQSDKSYNSHLRRPEDAAGTLVDCVTLGGEIALWRPYATDAPICVKIDCEGAEREIFEDESWIDQCAWIALEFHNQDGPFYREILARHGFKLDTTDTNPEAWRAIVYATKL
jgi:FkbM family methyltransferase